VSEMLPADPIREARFQTRNFRRVRVDADYIELVAHEGVSIREIALNTGYSRSVVRRAMRARGVPMPKAPYKTPSVRERFEKFFEPEPNTGCWLWMGTVERRCGYPQIWYEGTNCLAHRIAYELYVGPIPDGLVLDHLCRVRSCVNPKHLEAVTAAVNNARVPSFKRSRK
jgi:hypothetical protein